jgi:ribonuclease R
MAKPPFQTFKTTFKKSKKRDDKTPAAAPRTNFPPILVVEVTALSEEGELFGQPAVWEDEKRVAPRILLLEGTKGQAPTIGQRVLAKMQIGSRKYYTAQIIRILPEKAAPRVLGVYRPLKQGGILEPVSRKIKQEYYLAPEHCEGIKSGDLILAELLPKGHRRQLGIPEVKLLENMGDINNPRCYSLIAVHHHDIPTAFSEAALAEASAASAPVPEGRVDLREIPLVTIDGKDARDFDDAVFAEADGEGWHLIVAIADVAHYVKQGSPLDAEALNRGNSVYFPDRVVPMLPEALSNGLCSLNPNEDRYCLAVHLWINAEGELQRYEFVRGIMRSHARLVYEQAQEAFEAQDETLMPVLAPLYGAYQSLIKHRAERGALELDLPEFEIKMNSEGGVAEVKKRDRKDSHKLIEEFMICANVAAASAIEQHGTAGIFRIHEAPSRTKVEELRLFLKTLDHSLSQDATSKHFNRILKKVENTPESALISGAMLRSQMQAYYSPRNLGHFGLGLEKYCHFTSPIRRYADLVVHRALIHMMELQASGTKRAPKPEKEIADNLASIADHISQTERKAMLAEREANDRFVTAYMAGKLKAEFEGYITSVGNFGAFVTLKETGANGLIKMSDLGNDYFMYDERSHTLTGRDRGRRFQMGQRVTVMLMSADVALGTLRFLLVQADRLPEMDRKPKGKFDKKDRGEKKEWKPREEGFSRADRGKKSKWKPRGDNENGPYRGKSENAGEGRPERREWQERPSRQERSGDRPYREKSDRKEGGFKPRGEYKPRNTEGGEREQKRPYREKSERGSEPRPDRPYRVKTERTGETSGDERKKPYRAKEDGFKPRGEFKGKKSGGKFTKDSADKPRRAFDDKAGGKPKGGGKKTPYGTNGGFKPKAPSGSGKPASKGRGKPRR